MEKEIKKFKEENGNIRYSTKELLYGLNTKVDAIHERLSRGDRLLATHTTWNNAFKAGFFIVFTTLAYLIFV